MIINLPQQRQDDPMETELPLQYMVLGKVDSHMRMNEIRLLSYPIYKNQLKMN